MHIEQKDWRVFSSKVLDLCNWDIEVAFSASSNFVLLTLEKYVSNSSKTIS